MTITITIDGAEVAKTDCENTAPAVDLTKRAVKVAEVIDELQANIETYLPKAVTDAAFPAVKQEIYDIMNE